MDKHPDRGGREKQNPLGLDTRDPDQVTPFLLGLGYSHDNVVNTLVKRCNLDHQAARELVQRIANSLPQEV